MRRLHFRPPHGSSVDHRPPRSSARAGGAVVAPDEGPAGPGGRAGGGRLRGAGRRIRCRQDQPAQGRRRGAPRRGRLAVRPVRAPAVARALGPAAGHAGPFANVVGRDGAVLPALGRGDGRMAGLAEAAPATDGAGHRRRPVGRRRHARSAALPGPACRRTAFADGHQPSRRRVAARPSPARRAGGPAGGPHTPHPPGAAVAACGASGRFAGGPPGAGPVRTHPGQPVPVDAVARISHRGLAGLGA